MGGLPADDFCQVSQPGLGAGGVWLDPARTGQNLVWQLSWPPDIVASLASSINPQGTITNSDIELVALVLQDSTLLEAVPKARMVAPRSGSDNIPTVSWSMCEASMINPVVAYLLRIRALLGGVRIQVSDESITELNSLVARTNEKCYRGNKDILRDSKYSLERTCKTSII